ncbi:MAG: sulfatase [Armatimonadetes bacterium]|nr:sulfatase [Armatimonadota bacterium]
MIVLAVILGVACAGCSRSQRPSFTPASPTEASPAVTELREATSRASVVIVVLDAARADHVGCYGYPRPTTPNIDRLAAQSALLENHFAPYASTKCSTASLFTAQHADTHLAYANRQLPEDTFTLAQAFEQAGFRTVMFSSNPNAAPGTGLGSDFQDVYDQRQVEPLVENWEQFTHPAPLLALIRDWLAEHRRERFFMYVHFDPPHQPYLQPEEMRALFAEEPRPEFVPGPFAFPVDDRKRVQTALRPPLPEWINLYDGNLRFADWAVGELERHLRNAGVFDRSIFIVTADHGEAFGEHGYIWHERGVYDELLHIPLLIRLPGGAPGRRYEALTQSIDLLPTLCDLLEMPYPATGIDGISLLPLLAGLEDHTRAHVIARSDGSPPCYLFRTREWALILWGNGEWRALYDLQSDPGQRHNVIEDHPEVAARLLSDFREFARAQRRPPLEFLDPSAAPIPLPEGQETELSPETREQLRALGYLR